VQGKEIGREGVWGLGRRVFVPVAVVFVALAMAVFAFSPAAARAAFPTEFGSLGSGSGQLNEPLGAAVDQEEGPGDVYVVDSANRRVDKFTAEGNFLLAFGWGVSDGASELQVCEATCQQGGAGSGSGQFSAAWGVAVDNNPLSSSRGDVYVSDTDNHRVEKFGPNGEFLLMFGREVNAATKGDVCRLGEECKAGVGGSEDGEFLSRSITVGPNGDVYVGDVNRVQVFTAEGEMLPALKMEIPGGGWTSSVAVDGAGDVYAISPELTGVDKYSPSGELLETLDGEGVPHAAVLDAAGDVFVADDKNGGHSLRKYDASGALLEVFAEGEGEVFGIQGLAIGEQVGRLYLPSEDRRFDPPPTRVFVVGVPHGALVEGESVSEVLAGSATVQASINPEGHETSYRVEYGTTTAYGSVAPVPDASLTGDFEFHATSVQLSGLSLHTTYHYRIVASSECEENTTCTTEAPDQTFETKAAVLIDGESVSDVSATSATLRAEINPLGIPTTYEFRYGPSAACGGECVAPVPAGSVGSGKSDVTVTQHVQNLTAGSTYHYRVIASNTLGTVEGEPRPFTTQTGGGVVLPDGRRWELVSPANKQGSVLITDNQGEDILQAAGDGHAMTYLARAPTEANPQGFQNAMQVLSLRTTEGWRSQDIEIPHLQDTGVGGFGNGQEYRLFSTDLSLAALQPFGGFEPALSAEASGQTAYLRTDFQANGFCAGSCYRPLVTGKPGFANVPEGTPLEEGECAAAHTQANILCGPQFSGATADFAHVIVNSPVALTPAGLELPEGGEGLYEWSAGVLKLVSVLPGGSVGVRGTLGDITQGKFHGRGARAVAADGSRVVWASGGHLYLSDMSGAVGRSLLLDEGLSGQPRFQTADALDKHVYFTDDGSLYEYSLGHGLSRLTSGAEVSGYVIGASENASSVYFVAQGALSGVAGAVEAAPNLYVRHEGATSLVATLSSADSPDWGISGSFLAEYFQTAHVSPDGEWLVFMSQRSLTGYDNRDAVSGVPDEEVYVYDRASGVVRCASCDPSGARPVGREGADKDAASIALGETWSQVWVAANVPGWTVADYQPRLVSDTGRVFFNSSDGLVSGDVNGQEDVYEWEPAGVGGCSSAATGFSASSGGCVGLISSGASEEESAFVDASESGRDVFFLTSARLVPADFDTSRDMYDAHECSAAVPCFSEPATGVGTCVTADSCRSAPGVQPGVFGAPASATFSGPGNLTPAPVVGKSAARARAEKLARALKACHRKHSRRKRLVCVRRARRVYGARSAHGVDVGKGK
jgi:hypothetical protein